jgi:hypothetical protein
VPIQSGGVWQHDPVEQPWAIVGTPDRSRFIVERYAYGDPPPSPDQWRDPRDTLRWLADYVKAFRAGSGMSVVSVRRWPSSLLPHPRWRRVVEGEANTEWLTTALTRLLEEGVWKPGDGEPPLPDSA